MGLLKSALSLGGAAIGGAIGGPAGAKIGAALGGAAGGALSSSKGSAKATKAQLAAIEQAKGEAGKARTEAIGYQQPYLDFGRGSMNALSGRLGVSMPQPAPASTNALTMGGGGQTYDAGVGVPQRARGGPDDAPLTQPVTDTFGSPAEVSRAATAPAAPAVAGPVTGGVDPGTYGDTSNPVAPGPYEKPEAFSFDVDKFQNSPILQAALKRGSQEVQSSAAAGGSLYSGNTLKDLQDRALETSYRFFDNERGFAAGRNDAERNFDYGLTRDQRSDYERDRGYLTDRFDNQTDNLFRGVGVGQGAAGVASSAASKYGEQMVDLVTGAGEAKARNALTQGQIGSDLATGVGGVIAGAIGAGGASRNALTMQSGNVPFVNTPASISRNISYFKG